MERTGAKITRNGDRKRAPFRGSPPTLEEEALYWDWCVAEATLALERTDNARERGRLRRYLESVLAKHETVIKRLSALDREMALTGGIA